MKWIFSDEIQKYVVPVIAQAIVDPAQMKEAGQVGGVDAEAVFITLSRLFVLPTGLKNKTANVGKMVRNWRNLPCFIRT